MMKTIIIIAVILIIVVAVSLIDQIPKLYKHRNCQGIYWRRRYPGVPKEEIAKFLDIFCYTFVFKSKYHCKFKPDDKVMDIYKAVCPSEFFATGFNELPEFLITCQEEYEIDIEKIWNDDLTLGQIFDEIIRKKQKV